MYTFDLMQRAAARKYLPHLVLVALSSLWVIPASAAPKTDIVVFKNGDRLTGEIKSMRRGRLHLNTDATGTIAIEWDKIDSVVSEQNIQVETSSGIRFFGKLISSEKGSELIIATLAGPQSLDINQVIVMESIEDRGIHALDIDLTVGYNFAKAGGIETGNLGVTVAYRSLIRIESLKFSSIVSNSDTQDVSRRLNVDLQHTRLWKNRWFSNGGLSFDQNDELGLDLRTSLSAGGGRFLIQSNKILLSVEAGLQFSREKLTTEVDDTDSVEATFAAKWDWFLFQNPELDWSTEIQLIPNLTESGRVRGEFDTSLQWEIINDLKWGFSLYGSFDSQPQSPTGSTSDYGVNTNLTYKF